MAEQAKQKKRTAPVKKKAIELQTEDYKGWIFVAWVNPPWAAVEDLFEPQGLGNIRERLEDVIVGPWNFVDAKGDPIGKPYKGQTPKGEGPWSTPVRSEVTYEKDEEAGLVSRTVEKEGSFHKLGPDLIHAAMGAYQNEVMNLPNA